jgi:hypothetical protein
LPPVDSMLANAFHPGIELDDPALFAGRRSQVTELARNLHILGTCPVIYGARGLGKSSLALQAQRIAMGDITLLEDYGEDQWALEEGDTYIAFYITCSDATNDTSGILQLIINSFSSITTEAGAREPSQLVDRTTKKRITLKVFEAESLRRYQPPEASPTYRNLTVEEKVIDVASRISQAYGQRILVIIDELDRVRDTSGLASFIKNASSSDLKFLLVGIGQNISTLLSDHQSIERIAVPVEVPRMTEAELSQIVERAMARLADQGVVYAFSRAASKLLARVASGFPWFVHLLGQSALFAARRDGAIAVGRIHVASAARSLIDNRFAQQFRDMYQMAVRDSSQREMVLRTFALWPSQNIPTSDMYRVLKRLGVMNPSPYVGHLSSESYGQILMRPPFQERGIVRFANEMFKVYVRVRRPIFDVEASVRHAWRVEFRGTAFEADAEPILPDE